MSVAAAALVAVAITGLGGGAVASSRLMMARSAASSRLRAADIGFAGGGSLATPVLPSPESAAFIARLVDGRKTKKSMSTLVATGAIALERGSVPSI